VLKQPVLLFDGECAFCRDWVERLQRLDPSGIIMCLPSAERHTLKWLPSLTDGDLDRAMHFITPEGAVYAGAQALPPMLGRLPNLRWLAMAFGVPGVPWVSEKVYSEVARRRHRLACGSAGCRIGQDR